MFKIIHAHSVGPIYFSDLSVASTYIIHRVDQHIKTHPEEFESYKAQMSQTSIPDTKPSDFTLMAAWRDLLLQEYVVYFPVGYDISDMPEEEREAVEFWTPKGDEYTSDEDFLDFVKAAESDKSDPDEIFEEQLYKPEEDESVKEQLDKLSEEHGALNGIIDFASKIFPDIAKDIDLKDNPEKLMSKLVDKVYQMTKSNLGDQETEHPKLISVSEYAKPPAAMVVDLDTFYSEGHLAFIVSMLRNILSDIEQAQPVSRTDLVLLGAFINDTLS